MNAQAVAKWFKDAFAPSQEAAKPHVPAKRTIIGTPSKGDDDFRDAFFSTPDDPSEKRTNLQERIQSGRG